jgi:hypothetical protein
MWKFVTGAKEPPAKKSKKRLPKTFTSGNRPTSGETNLFLLLAPVLETPKNI